MANMTIGGSNPYVNQYNRISNSSQQTMQRIATGSMRPTASMGASEYAISARLSSNIGATSQSIQNTQNISAMIRTAAGATSNTVGVLATLKEHILSAVNDSNNTLDRRAVQENINQLVSQINDNAAADYNGIRLIDGSQENLMVAGIDGYENFSLGNLTSQSLGLTDANGNVTIDVSTAESAQNALAIVDNAATVAGNTLNSTQFMADYVTDGISLNQALDEATTQGAQLQRLEYQQANYVTMEENQIAAQSNINDADIAQQITNLHNEQTLQQLALSATNMFNQNRASILNMLP